MSAIPTEGGRAEIGRWLAKEIAIRLAAVVPPDIVVSCVDGAIVFEAAHCDWRASSNVGALVDQPVDLEIGVEIAALNALDVAQDFCSEAL